MQARKLPTVAIVGAGISGLVCARALADHDVPVTIFEKSRGVGGRMATRRAESDMQFDHGAQYFTVRDSQFERWVQRWLQDGIVATPANQAVELLSAIPSLSERASSVEMRPCWAVMLALPESLKLSFDAAFVHKSALSWIACNSSKPSRFDQPETWVLHASSVWSETNIEESANVIEDKLLAEFWQAIASSFQKRRLGKM